MKIESAVWHEIDGTAKYKPNVGKLAVFKDQEVVLLQNNKKAKDISHKREH